MVSIPGKPFNHPMPIGFRNQLLIFLLGSKTFDHLLTARVRHENPAARNHYFFDLESGGTDVQTVLALD